MSVMGYRICSKRKEMGFTMKELADKLGVQASAVNKWEKGTVENIKRGTIEEMAKLFGCSPVWLMGLESNDYIVNLDNEDNSNIIIECHYPNSESTSKRLARYLDIMEQMSEEQLDILDAFFESFAAKKEQT